MDKLSIEKRIKSLQTLKSKGSKIETLLGKEMLKIGLRYRNNDKADFGKQDFTFKKYKVAVFCDSELWHGKDWETIKHEHKSKH